MCMYVYVYRLNFLERPRVYFHGWSWVQSDQKEVRSEFDWSTGPCCRPWPACYANTMFSSIMPPWGRIMLNVSWHFWVICEMLCSGVSSRIMSRWRILSTWFCGTISVFTTASISESDSPQLRNHHNLLFTVCPIPEPSGLVLLLFKSVEGLWPAALHQGKISCRPWNWPMMT